MVFLENVFCIGKFPPWQHPDTYALFALKACKLAWKKAWKNTTRFTFHRLHWGFGCYVWYTQLSRWVLANFLVIKTRPVYVEIMMEYCLVYVAVIIYVHIPVFACILPVFDTLAQWLDAFGWDCSHQGAVLEGVLKTSCVQIIQAFFASHFSLW